MLRAEKHDPLAPPPVKSDQQAVTDLLASRLALLNNWHPQEFRRVLGELVGKLEPN
jgi:hypothetical protein